MLIGPELNYCGGKTATTKLHIVKSPDSSGLCGRTFKNMKGGYGNPVDLEEFASTMRAGEICDKCSQLALPMIIEWLESQPEETTE